MVVFKLACGAMNTSIITRLVKIISAALFSPQERVCATARRTEDQAVIRFQGYFIGSGICSAIDIQLSILVMARVRKFLNTTVTAITAHTFL